jgi:hypothetical protein
MDTGALLTRATIWLSIIAYAVGIAVFAFSGRRVNGDRFTRILWTIGLIGLFAHVICAFQFFHSWSHDAAYRDTARQTFEVVGMNWGGGLYINYLILILWTLDLGWWWWGGIESYRRRGWTLIAGWHAFLIFIIFNATVVFTQGLSRWFGLLVCICIVTAWWFVLRQTFNTETGGTN